MARYSRIVRHSVSAGLACILMALALPAAAGQRLLLGINTGMASQDNQLDLREKYKPLATYLSAATGRDIRLEVSQNLDSSERRLQRDAYDAFLGPPQTIAQAMKDAQYVPLARYPGKIRSAFVVLDSSGMTRFTDLRGKRIGMPDEMSLPSYLALAKIRFSRLKPETFFAEIHYQKFQDAVMDALLVGRVDVAVATSGFARKWVASHPGTRIIEQTYEVPHFALAVSPEMPASDQRAIQQALINANDSEAGQAALAALGRKTGFIKTDAAEFSPLIRLFGL